MANGNKIARVYGLNDSCAASNAISIIKNAGYDVYVTNVQPSDFATLTSGIGVSKLPAVQTENHLLEGMPEIRSHFKEAISEE